MNNEQITALAAEFAQLKAEHGAFGINLTTNAKAQIEVVAEKIGALQITSARAEIASTGKPGAQRKTPQV